jgi:pyruvate,orthophosphate dikinase
MSDVTALPTVKWIYDFREGAREMRELLGGKGAGLAEMARVLGPELVPSGFTITTEACVRFLREGSAPAGLGAELDAAVARLETAAGRRFGDAEDPLLLAVRSGARDSMPGMMDTVLNLGLNDVSVHGLAEHTGDERFAWDSYRRLVQMFGNVVHGVESARFERELAAIKDATGVRVDSQLSVAALQELTRRFQRAFDFPADPREQLRQAVEAVFASWNGDRAVAYRRIRGIPDDWGTAVNVQQMVFGNLGMTSGSGVAFSRDEVTGAPEPSGDFLINAQGEDVVSGVRTPRDLRELDDWLPGVRDELVGILRRLERHYGDMQDTEFTIERGRLYMLQTRSAKRHARAAVRFAADAVAEGLLTQERALATVDAGALDALLHPTLDPEVPFETVARGVAASPGAACGEIVLTAAAAVAAAEAGRDVILVRPFTEADDVAGFHAAKGILTSQGGKASHAALVARGMGRPAVTGAADVHVDLEHGVVRIGEHALAEGDRIIIDGTSGAVTLDEVPLVPAPPDPYFERILAWADGVRTLGVRANADTPADAIRARELGAEGIGLCRTEHMFMAADRQPLMRAMILAADDESRSSALAALLPLQQADFEGLFEAMEGLPVTIRLLDPPLHEFVPDRAELREENPMLGTRGVRLGLLHPDIYAMQVRAIARAVAAVRRGGGVPPRVEIMIPLVAYVGELEEARELVRQVLADEGESPDGYAIGTMIELPRACLVAGDIAARAAFFSFGTNDLTQTALGFSRDDIEASVLPVYADRHIVDRSPFGTIDIDGVGELIEIALARGRRARPDLTAGVCGEHGGDPDSIRFFHGAGVDYVSCSPFRVPIARVAAAQAVIEP